MRICERRRGGFEAGSKESEDLLLAKLNRSHYKYHSGTMVPLRDLKPLEVKENKPKLEGIVKVFWILKEELEETERECR